MSSVIGKLSRRSKFFTKSFVTPCNLEALAVSNFLRQLEMSAGSQFSLRLAPEISAPHFLRTSHRCSAYLHCKSRIDSLALSYTRKFKSFYFLLPLRFPSAHKSRRSLVSTNLLVCLLSCKAPRYQD